MGSPSRGKKVYDHMLMWAGAGSMRRTFTAVLPSRWGVGRGVPARADADAEDRLAVGELGTRCRPLDADALPGWLLVGGGAVRGPGFPRNVSRFDEVTSNDVKRNLRGVE